MLLLQTFGGLRLKTDAGSAALTQRRRLALLALLAGAGEHGLAREKISAYLWPDAALDNTRGSLDQLVYAIRNSAGEAALIGTNPLQLNLTVVEADVVLFQQALSTGALEAAVALYHGPFLDGFYIPNAPGFERWVESERSRLAERFAGALEQLASAAQARGDLAGAIDWWRKLAAHDPLRAPGALGLMRALAASGDRAGALGYARVYERLTMQELESAPDPLIAKLVEELKQASARDDAAAQFAAPAKVSVKPDETTTGSTPIEPTALGGTASPQGGSRRLRLAVIVAVAAAAIGGIWTRWGASVGAPTPRQATMLITPFRIVGADSSLREFGEGMVDLLSAEFTGEGGPLAVDPRTAINAWSRVSAEGRSTVEDARQIANRAGAEWALVGDLVNLPAGQVRLGGRLIRVADGAQQIVPAVTAPRDSLAMAVNGFAGTVLTLVAGTAESKTASMTASLPALRAYLAGRAEHRRAQGTAAVASFARALEFDSTFALAALDLVSATGWLLRWAVVSPFDSGRRIASLLPGSNPSRTASDDARFDRAMRIAWRERARLSGRDRALLEALHGERYPDPSYAREVLASLSARR